MDLMLNGETRTFSEGMSVAQLLQQLAIAPERVAVEVNLTVLKRAQHPATLLKEGDQVEIVQLIGGGATQTQGARRRTQGNALSPGS